MNTVELIFINDQYEIADHHNSEPFADAVNENGRWRYPEYKGQRVRFSQLPVEFSFTAIEIDGSNLDLDDLEDGIFIVDDKFYKALT